MNFRSIALATISFISIHGVALADPPARVGRLSYIDGTVSSHTAEQEDWVAAELNYPVTTGSSLWNEPGAKSEIEAGGMELRIDQSTEVDITRLDDVGTVITVPQGAINLHLANLPEGGVQIQTPGGEVDVTKPGVYHIDAGQPDPNNPDNPPATTQVMVLQGEANLTTPSSNTIIQTGKTAIIGTNPPSLVVQQARPTPFDNWALSREKSEVARQTPQYISPETTGYEDLDSQGAWQPTPEYGQVWYPTAVAVDWAPYRYGHWAFVAPWGWTWIDDAPWGFAPFHYGRWVHLHDRWGWCPGERHERPVYAPALVAFVGGHDFNVTLSQGRRGPGVGWVPLAPHEVFHPYYPTSVNYARRVNINNVNRTVINNITVNNVHNTTVNHYANAGNATVVTSDTFSHGRPVHQGIVQVPHNQLVTTNVSTGPDHIVPTQDARGDFKNHPAPAPHNFRMPETRINQPQTPIADVRKIPTDMPPKPIIKDYGPVGEPRIPRNQPEIIRPVTQVTPPTITKPTIIRPIAHPVLAPTIETQPPRLEQTRPEIIRPQIRPNLEPVRSEPTKSETRQPEAQDIRSFHPDVQRSEQRVIQQPDSRQLNFRQQRNEVIHEPRKEDAPHENPQPQHSQPSNLTPTDERHK